MSRNSLNFNEFVKQIFEKEEEEEGVIKDICTEIHSKDSLVPGTQRQPGRPHDYALHRSVMKQLSDG